MTIYNYPVAVIGAGPVGMAAAAHLAVRKIPFLIFEAGSSVGSSVLSWGHVRLFSPWIYNIDKAAEKLLTDLHWYKPDENRLPTGNEIVDHYLLPLSLHPLIKGSLHLSAKVVSVTKRGMNKVRIKDREKMPFVLTVQEDTQLNRYEASSIIDASGTWQNPNPIGEGGFFAAGEEKAREKIVYGIPNIFGKEKKRYAGRSVMVVGGGHSALNSVLALASLKKDYSGTRVHWVLQNNNLNQLYGAIQYDALKGRRELEIGIQELVRSGNVEIHAPFFINEVLRIEGGLVVNGYKGLTQHEVAGIDEIISNTGARPDILLFRELRVQVDVGLECVPGLAAAIDPNTHDCGTVQPHGELDLRQPDGGFYVVGAKSYGRASTFLMATGYEQVRSIIAYLHGDLEAARRIELNLPGALVCTTPKADGHRVLKSAEIELNDRDASCCSPNGKSKKIQRDSGECHCHGS